MSWTASSGPANAFQSFAGLVWLNYGYWYGAGGERMRAVADWVTSMLAVLAARPTGPGPVEIDVAERLQSTMKRLTDLDFYPDEILAVCVEPLERWRQHVVEQRST